MKEPESKGLGKGDVISFLALLLMGVIVFFGMNFKTLGDKIPSLVVAIVLVVLMTVFVFLAAYAKKQNRNRDTWRILQAAMLGLYVLALIPCYFYSSRFFDVYLQKSTIMEQVQKDTDDLDKMFADYSKKCEARASSYQIDMEAMLTYDEGRKKIAEMLDISDPKLVTKENVAQAASSFSKSLKGAEYKAIEAEKNTLVKNCESNFRSWNILLIPQYASELGTAKTKCATELERIYSKYENNIEKNRPEFNAQAYIEESGVIDSFKGTNSFSVLGLVATLFLGILGLVKYLMGNGSNEVEMKRGTEENIKKYGGFVVKKDGVR